MNLDLNYYFSVFLRRIYVLVIIAVGFTAAAVYVALELPPSYEARAQLLVESPQIPNSLAASTVQTGAVEQLQIIEQRLMTRPNLLQVAREHDVFAGVERLSADQIVSNMRAQTRIRTSGRGATFMSIEFTSDNAQTAANVVNEYVTRIMQANRGLRTEVAEQTLEFFQQEVDRLNAELARQSARIVAFKREHQGALPTSVEFRQSQRAGLQERLVQIDRDLDMLNDQKERLVQLYESGGQLGVPEEQLSPDARRLAELQKELDSALAVFSPANPRIRVLEARIDQLEQKISASGDDATDSGTDPRETMFNMQFTEIDTRTEYLEEQRELIAEELERIGESLDRTPEVTIDIEALERDYQNIQSQYNTAISRLSAAATGERIELLAKGERITVVEQATPPGAPTSPNRPLIAGTGAAAGIGLGLAAIVLLELLNQSIRRPVDLEGKLGITPLATLPYIRTRRELIWKRSVILLLIAAVVVGGPALLYAVHTFYLPLDLLIERAAAKLPF